MDASINTISDFVKTLEAEIRVFDMGRKVERISNGLFQKFENFEIPFPTPLQKHAWLGIVIWWQETQQEPLIWFLKLPLDEQGMIIPASRDDFIQRLMKAVQNRLHNPESKDQSILNESELAFTPNQERMASFHAKTSSFLGKTTSSYYEPAISYLKKEGAPKDWESLGLQGLADICSRLNEFNHETIINNALVWLPETPQAIVLSLLENETVGTELSLTLLKMAEQELKEDQPNGNKLSYLLRAMTGSKAIQKRQALILKLLSDDRCNKHIEILATIAGRLWHDLENTELCLSLFEQIAQQENGQALFVQFFLDLVAIPGVRPWVMNAIRNPERSEELSTCVGMLFGNR